MTIDRGRARLLDAQDAALAARSVELEDLEHFDEWTARATALQLRRAYRSALRAARRLDDHAAEFYRQDHP